MNKLNGGIFQDSDDELVRTADAIVANVLENTPGATDTDLAGTGFAPRQAATHTDAPQNVRLKATSATGQLQILLAAAVARGVLRSGLHARPRQRPLDSRSPFNGTRGVMLEGLTRGKNHQVCGRAVASGQNHGPWSDTANALAM